MESKGFKESETVHKGIPFGGMIMGDMLVKFKYISALDGVSIGGKLYMVDRNDNGLYAVDEVSREIEFLGHLGSRKYGVIAEFSFILSYNEKLYILPQNGFYLAIYDIQSGDIETIQVPHENEERGFGAAGGFFLDGWLYIFSCLNRYAPLRLRLSDCKVEVLDDMWNSLAGLQQGDDLYRLDGFAWDGIKFYFGIYNTNQLYAWSMKSRKIEKVLRLPLDFPIGKIGLIGEDCLLVASKNSSCMAKVYLESQMVEYKKIDSWDDDTIAIKIVSGVGCVWLVPYLGTKIIYYDVGKDVFSEVSFDKQILPEDCLEKDRCFYGCREHEGTLYLYRHGKNGVLTVRKKSGLTKFYSLDKEENKVWQEIIKENYWQFLDFSDIENETIIYEGWYNLLLYMDFISKRRLEGNPSIRMEFSVGQKIWDLMKADASVSNTFSHSVI